MPKPRETAAFRAILFTPFSFPGGIPSYIAPETPGSIHESGEQGYALSHASVMKSPKDTGSQRGDDKHVSPP